MGAKASVVYGHCKRLLIRYNAENRAHKLLDKEKLSVSPRHPLPERLSNVSDMRLSKEKLEELHGKNEQLSDYLKKVYLTSTSTITGTPSKRPKPKKENEVFKKKMFLDPVKLTPGHCTLTNVLEILLKFQDNPESFSLQDTARNLNLDKKDISQLVMYYSLFTKEDFSFMHAQPQPPEESEKIEFEVHTQLEKKPLKRIESK